MSNFFSLNSIYTFSFILSFCYLFVLISVYRHRISPFFIMLFVAIMLSNFGYMQLSDADTVKMALYANQVVYLGAAYSAYFLFMCLADLCKEKISVKIQTLMVIYGSMLFFFASTVGVFDFYYQKVDLIKVNNVSILVKDYGPLHILYPLYLAITMGADVFIIVRSFFKRKTVSYKNSIMLLFAMIVTIMAYILKGEVPEGFPILPLAYDVALTIAFILITRISLYDVAAISSDVILETSISGIICFDSKGRFLGADNDALNWFPETQSLRIDSRIQNANTNFFKQVQKWIDGTAKKDSVIIKQEDYHIQCDHSLKTENKHNAVHVIFLRDVTESQKSKEIMESYNSTLEKEVRQRSKKARNLMNDIILGMANLVEDRDSNTGGHIQRTSEVVNIFIRHLRKHPDYKDIPETIWHNIIKAAPLHDLGKIGIPDEILNKPGRFTPDEFEKMKTHAERGAKNVKKILRNSEDKEFKNIAENVAHYHHEKWNGAGYPNSLSGSDIPFEARVMALADVFDALVSKRVYKESMSYEEAFEIIKKDAGSHFDPDLCRHFLHCRKDLEALYDKYSE